jgi:hypothetical protein
VSVLALRPTLLPIQNGLLLDGKVKIFWCEADYLPQSSADGKNGEAIHPLPIHPHGIVLISLNLSTILHIFYLSKKQEYIELIMK